MADQTNRAEDAGQDPGQGAGKTTDSLGRTMRRYSVQRGHNAFDLENARGVLGYTYPIDQRPGERVTDELLTEIADVLLRHGYPPVMPGGDVERLTKTLYGFLYRPVI